jgi:hypothetical protein
MPQKPLMLKHLATEQGMERFWYISIPLVPKYRANNRKSDEKFSAPDITGEIQGD